MDLGILHQWHNRAQKGIIIDRSARIRREGSPVYLWTPGVIAAAATVVIETRAQFPNSRKYEPLDSIEVVNNEVANNITLTINGGDARYIPAGTIRHIHGRGVALWHIAITNDGAGNTTAGLITVTLQKEPYTINKWAVDDYG